MKDRVTGYGHPYLISYSLLSEFTGFSVAARQLPTVTTAKTICETSSNATANTHQLIGAL